MDCLLGCARQEGGLGSKLNYTPGSPSQVSQSGFSTWPLATKLFMYINIASLELNALNKNSFPEPLSLLQTLILVSNIYCRTSIIQLQCNVQLYWVCVFFLHCLTAFIGVCLKPRSTEFDTSDPCVASSAVKQHANKLSLPFSWLRAMRTNVQQLNWCGKDDYRTENTNATTIIYIEEKCALSPYHRRERELTFYFSI